MNVVVERGSMGMRRVPSIGTTEEMPSAKPNLLDVEAIEASSVLGIAPSHHIEQIPKRRTRSFGLGLPLLFLDIVLSTDEESRSRS